MKPFIFIMCTSLFFLCTNPAFATERSKEEILHILMQANPRVEYATIVSDTPLLAEPHVDAEVIAFIEQSAQAEILEDKTTIWYRVRHSQTDEIGWVQRKYLEIPIEEPSIKTRMSKEHVEAYVNLLSFQSNTTYFVWVDLQRQLVNILEGEKGNFQLTNVLPCSSGKAESPTLKGLFEIQERGVWFYSERLKSGAQFWVRFHGSYLFHSIPMDKSKTILDDTIGERSSSGCIRLNIPDAEWFYNHIPDGTSVFIQ